MKTLTEMLIDLRLDLKDTAALWSDAELIRSVKKAVADLSRFLPLEKSYELTIDTTVTSESFTTLAATSATTIVNAASLATVKSGDTCTLTGSQPDLPRTVKITVTDANASITAFTIIVKGNDADGNYIEECFYFAGGLVQTGKRYFKKVTSVEVDAIAGNGTADTLSVGLGTPTGVWISLANKPIRPRSESVTSVAGTTTYARDTDYLMDDVNGKIALKSGGSMAAATAYLIGYTKSRISIDLSSISDFIRANRVEYPTRNVPQTFISWDMWAKIITFAGAANESQSEFADKEHAVIQYYAEHFPPGVSAPGSYPSFLDATVELAAGAYALFIKAIQYEHQAVTDFASSRTALGSIAAVHTLAKAALALADTQLDSAVVAGLFTKVDVALDAIATKVGLVDTYLTGSTAPAAKKYLDDGDAYLTILNDADNVPQKHADFARASIELAQALLKESEAYVGEATVRLQESDRWTSAARAWIEQANSYVYEMDRYLEEANRYIVIAQDCLIIADKFRTEAIEKRNEAWSIWRDSSQYLGDFSLTTLRQQPNYKD
jgi:hypothetical protein